MAGRAPQEISIEIMRVLAGIRSSLDIANTTANERSRSSDHIREAYLKFEAARIAFRQSSRGPRAGGPAYNRSKIIALVDDLSALRDESSFSLIAQTIQYRPMPSQRGAEWNLHPALEDRGLSVLEAIEFLVQSISENIPSRALTPQADLFETVEKLDAVLPPSQSVAPLQFQISNGKLALKQQRPTADRDDANNIAEARSHLEEDGEKILTYLAQSNCDKRIIDSVQDLQDQLKSGKNIVRLGLTSIGCDLLCDKMTQEIPDAVSALLKAHTIGMGMYVAQFSEWQRFSGQAAQVSLSNSDIENLRLASNELITHLRSTPEAADPNVANALSSIRRLTDAAGSTLTKAAFALWRSIENLAITVFNYGNSVARKTADNLADDLASAASKAITRSLMAAALAGVVYLTPISSNLPGGAWLSKAADLVKQQVEQLSRGD
ncbi:hypothetical protein [uncultured Sphingomonas sp.]|uniref:hypothetical protein n=1 Tax=uncultured Sphingomonas sp. TaxID=158754 RepID=UPI0025E5C98B|nr:hypothetical protein [uncultured Sphingomonas sp.]